MEAQIVQVDLSKLDADIAETRQRLELLLNTKKYTQSIAIGGNIIRPVVPTGNGMPDNMGVSAFILHILTSNGRSETKAIINAYANYTHKKPEDISGNVSNALSRLKTDKKVNNEEKPGGRRAGSVWFITN